MSLINPSFAGAEADNMVALTSRNQWASIENSPKTQVLTFSSKRKKNVGLGISIMSNNYFVEKSICFSTSAKCRRQFSKKANHEDGS